MLPKLAPLLLLLVLAAPAEARLTAVDAVAPGTTGPVLAGANVVWGIGTKARGVRLKAAPAAGGAIVTTFRLDPAKGRAVAIQSLAASSSRVAFVTASRTQQDGYAGKPGGPYARVLAGDADATPLEAFASGEVALFRAAGRKGQQLVAGSAKEPLPEEVGGAAIRVAGDFLAYGRPNRGVFVVDRRTDELVTTLAGNARGFDLAADGRVVALMNVDLVEARPRRPRRTIARGIDGSAVRIAGEGAVVSVPVNESAERLVHVAADGSRRALSPPTASLASFEATNAFAAWQANGCLLTAGLQDAGRAADAVPAGRCARAEAVAVAERPLRPDRRSRIQVTIACISSATARCTGTVLGARFSVPRGRTAPVTVRLRRCRRTLPVPVRVAKAPVQTTYVEIARCR